MRPEVDSRVRQARAAVLKALRNKFGKPFDRIEIAGPSAFEATDEEESRLAEQWAHLNGEIDQATNTWTRTIENLEALIAEGHDVAGTKPTDERAYTDAVGTLSVLVASARDHHDFTLAEAKLGNPGLVGAVGHAVTNLRIKERELSVFQGLRSHAGNAAALRPAALEAVTVAAEGFVGRPMRDAVPSPPWDQEAGQPYRELLKQMESEQRDPGIPTISYLRPPKVREYWFDFIAPVNWVGFVLRVSLGLSLVALAVAMYFDESVRVSFVLELGLAILGGAVTLGAVAYKAGFDFLGKGSERRFNSAVQETITTILAILDEGRPISLTAARAERGRYDREVLNTAIDELLKRKEIEIDLRNFAVRPRRQLAAG